MDRQAINFKAKGGIEMSEQQSPIGIFPKWAVEEKRAAEIEDAIARFDNAGKEIPLEWYEELYELRLNWVRREIKKQK